MDALSSLLRGVRADGVVLSRPTASPPWALRVHSAASISLCTPMCRQGWLVIPGQPEPILLRPGDTVLVRGPVDFSFIDDVDSAIERTCTDLPSAGGQAVVIEDQAEAPEGSAALLVAEFPIDGAVGRRLLEELPPVLVVPADPSCGTTLDYIAAEIAADQPGQQVVLERLLEWVLVCSLRAWFDSPQVIAPAWYPAMSDPVVGPALRAMHGDHARPWTVAALASTAHVSRATLAKRFTELVGEPPLTYLTGWRMTLAADLLSEPGASVADVARRVGYADPFGFSAAFKRTRGTSPSEYRRPNASAAAG
ncbi:AraC family transcriptional regulator [Ruania zhangjianzhongii]|uniref:AraC family transcriptional regulator n=1 Tax=Ruania zhangjianzhongii TaxID=2603206 RepID=UPI0011CA6B66|nr:AraC family transcriptional regulator [Ruania zhangjianzhongii]